MAHWNYRLIHMDIKSPDEPWYEIHEVYYDDAGNVRFYTLEAADVCGESPRDVVSSLETMLNDAKGRPLLKESELPTRPV